MVLRVLLLMAMIQVLLSVPALGAQSPQPGSTMFVDRLDEMVQLTPAQRQRALILVDRYNLSMRPIRNWLEEQSRLGKAGARQFAIDSAGQIIIDARARVDDSLRALFTPRQRAVWDSIAHAANQRKRAGLKPEIKAPSAAPRRGDAESTRQLAQANAGARPNSADSFRVILENLPLQAVGQVTATLMPPARGEVIAEIREGRLFPSKVVLLSRGEVASYDRATGILALIGRRGDGPGDFRFPTHIGVGRQDSLWVYDQIAQRVTTFGEARLRPSTWVLPVIRGLVQPAVVGQLEGGALVIRQEAMPLQADGPARIDRPMVPIIVIDRRTVTARTVITLPGIERAIVPRGPAGNNAGFMLTQREFGGELAIGVGSSWIAVGDTKNPSIQFLSPAGRIEQVVSWNQPPIPITSAELQRSRDREVDAGGSKTFVDALKASFARRPTPPPYLPMFNSALVFDHEQRLWVPLTAGGMASMRTWLVWDPSQHVAARLALASEWRVLDADTAVVLAVKTLESGEEMLALLALPRGLRRH